MGFFIPPALYYGGIAALGAGARAINSPTGQNVIRSGQNLFNRGVTGLQNYANPIMNKMFSSSINVPLRYFDKGVSKATKAPNMFSAITPSLGVYNYADDLPQLITDAGYFSGADDASKLITGEGESGLLEDLGLFDAAGAVIDKITGNNSKDKKEDKKEDKKKKKETKENKEPSIDDLPLDAEEARKKKNLKKGGYVKKQRKRKPYKSSSFAKMKKSKKRKYI